MRNHLLPLEAAKKVDDEARTFALGLIDEWLPHPRRNGDVRVGSDSDIRQAYRNVRFSPMGDIRITLVFLPPLAAYG
jgi:hypothetical protein